MNKLNNNIKGLSNKEVEEQIQLGNTNHYQEIGTLTYKQIVINNIFTLFNAINCILALLVITTGQYKNLLFMSIVFWNIFIGIFQEIRTKKILDKLSLLNEQTYSVIRENTVHKIEKDNIVLNDIFILEAGQQIPCDAIIIDGHLEVNESLITGESDVIIKNNQDELISSSIVVSGRAYCKAVKVGKNSYANKLLFEVKQNKKNESELLNSIQRIVKIISIIIIPIGILLFIKQFYLSKIDYSSSILSTVAALIGMIPEGVVLLTTIALGMGAITLARKKALIQQLSCIESLARVDTICCDKTGTITKGEMQVIDFLEQKITTSEAQQLLSRVINDIDDNNATALALKNFATHNNINWKIASTLNFSSQRKLSAIAYKNIGTFIIGAYEFISKEEVPESIQFQSNNGNRVITFAYCKDSLINYDNIKEVEKTILGYFVLADPIRENAIDTFNYFYNQNVEIKIISGDNPKTVEKIAADAGIRNISAIDAQELKNDNELKNAVCNNNVFGRVTPEQKQKMIRFLQEDGHKVAMTGDGVNDILALKNADCSIAMGNGSDATKNIANIVLLDSNFNVMPLILQEGRKVINNITRTTSLFLIKTFLSIILSIATIFFVNRYPFLPIQLSVVASLAIGMPAYILTLENNKQPIAQDFLSTVVSKSLPASISSFLVIIFIHIFNNLFNLNFTDLELSTLSTIMLGLNIFYVLYKISIPFTKLRFVTFITFFIIFILALIAIPLLPLKNPIFAIINIRMLMCIGIFTLLIPITQNILYNLLKKIKEKNAK